MLKHKCEGLTWLLKQTRTSGENEGESLPNLCKCSLQLAIFRFLASWIINHIYRIYFQGCIDQTLGLHRNQRAKVSSWYELFQSIIQHLHDYLIGLQLPECFEAS